MDSRQKQALLDTSEAIGHLKSAGKALDDAMTLLGDASYAVDSWSLDTFHDDTEKLSKEVSSLISKLQTHRFKVMR